MHILYEDYSIVSSIIHLIKMKIHSDAINIYISFLLTDYTWQNTHGLLSEMIMHS